MWVSTSLDVGIEGKPIFSDVVSLLLRPLIATEG